ncbi:MAG: roadblock/LC7 domain-containing protein [Micromonosporaceae bacterium]
MTDLGVYRRSVGMLLASLVARTPGLAHAVLLSAQGVPVATSSGLPPARAEQLAAIGAGLLSLADGASRCTSSGQTRQVVVEMTEGVLLTVPIAPQLHLSLLATSECSREQLGYELLRFAADVGPLLGPDGD